MSKRLAIVVVALLGLGAGAWWYLRSQGPPPGEAKRDPAPPRAVGHGASAPAQGGLSGRVVDDKGKPVSGAVVNLGGDRTLRVDAGGAFSWEDLPVGRYALSASAPGYLPAVREDLAVAAGQVTRGVDLVLRPGGRVLEGTVSDRTGGPIAEAVVTAVPVHGMLSTRGGRPVAALTDAQGRYRLGIGDGRQRVTASHPDYVADSRIVEGTGGAVDFALTPGSVIEGVVRVHGTGAAVPGARVSFDREGRAGMPGGAALTVGTRGGSVTADAEGRFRVGGLEAGTIRLFARSGNLASREPVAVATGVADSVTGVEIFLDPARIVAGSVTWEDGSPAAGVQVVLMSRGEPGRSPGARTDEAGRFRIEGVFPGRYGARALGDDVLDPEPVRVEVAATDVTDLALTAKRGVAIGGKVEPPMVAEIRVIPAEEGGAQPRGPRMMLRGLRESALAREDGVFRVHGVAPGKAVVEARAADGRRGSVTVDVPPGGVTDLVIPLAPMAQVAGRVRTPDGKPVPGAVVKLTPGGEAGNTMIVNGRDVGGERAPAGADGRFALAGLAPGEYTLSVRSEQGEDMEWAGAPPPPVRLVADERKDGLDLVVLPRDGNITGVVVDDKGAPVADAWVTATPSRGEELLPSGPRGPGPQVRTRVIMMIQEDDDTGVDAGSGSGVPPALTDDQGRFELRGLARGDYRLAAEGHKGTARGGLSKVTTGSAPVSIRLEPLTELGGRVRDDAGRPVTAFNVLVEGGPDPAAPVTRTQAFQTADGQFRMGRVEPGKYRVRVSADGGVGEATVEIAAGERGQVEVRLARFAKVTGTVFDGGKPLAGARVVAAPAQPGGGMRISIEGEPARTDRDGRFELDVPAGKHVFLVLGDGMGPLVKKPIDVAPGATLELGRLDTEAAPQEGPRKASL